ncbi:MAG: YhcH/YjgK/YiaL family protein [Candidatus Gastranaerophilales bacterium]|nr:YhcH/YjgK/YiaL family protein [Candidatus Gastranaerophilales bacterium]
MIVDNIENFEMYISLNDKFETVKQFISEHDLSTMEPKRYYIDEENLYVNIEEYVTKQDSSSKPESHKKYIDIQMVIEGEELIGYSDVKKCSQYTFYDDKKDIEFLNGDVDFVKADNTNFFIFFPSDAHKPSIAVNELGSKVKKAVFKIKI